MSVPDPAAAGFDRSRLARVREHLWARYVEPGKVAGCQVVVFRRGHLAYDVTIGMMDRERGRPVADDTIWRLYSMTKPITGVALLSLLEQAACQLSDPVSRFLPEWSDAQVRERDAERNVRLVPPARPMTVRDVLMHMSGIGFGPRGARLDFTALASGGGKPTDVTLAELSKLLAAEPLRFHPGTHWLYSWSTDICARLVEVLSGQRFDEYLRTAVFEPLGMADTGFFVPDGKLDRFAACYGRDAQKRLVLVDDPETSRYRTTPTLLSGGGGLVGTAVDYLRFCRMLLNGGELDGARILSRKTIELMTSNHLPHGGQLRDVALPGGYGEVGFDGTGFGLTVAVGLGPVATQNLTSVGEFMWGGLASTAFWVDPLESTIVVFMTQLIPSATFNFRGQLRALVNGALAE